MNNLLEFTDKGIYCEKAGVFIDPWKPVEKALITHAHSDHARYGNQAYLAHQLSAPIMKYRLGNDINIQSVEYGEQININQVKFSFHPAGHIPGSSQIRVEYGGMVWVVTGDYKLVDDHFSTPFEPVKSDVMITECTFGLPIFKWKAQAQVYQEINEWWAQNKSQGITSVLFSYALGKAQRLINALDTNIGEIFTHGAVEYTNEVLRDSGLKIQPTTKVSKEVLKERFKGSMVIAPPSAHNTSWMRKFQPYSTGMASGWMMLRGARRRRAVDRGFILSDHADWDELNTAIHQSGAKKIITTHGYTAIFSKWLREQGYDTTEENTAFEGELFEVNESETTQNEVS